MSYPMTQTGFDRLGDELRDLKYSRRPAVIAAIAAAREHGDLKENAEYHAAREQQSHIEGRIIEIENIVSQANIIDISSINIDTVAFGASVKIVNEETDEESEYQIVGEVEADFNKGRISNISPLGKALIGKEVGDSIDFQAPGGVKYYEILSIEYNNG